jgi:hypothetical protein
MAKTHPTTNQSSRESKPATRAHAFSIVEFSGEGKNSPGRSDVDAGSSFI